LNCQERSLARCYSVSQSAIGRLVATTWHQRNATLAL